MALHRGQPGRQPPRPPGIETRGIAFADAIEPARSEYFLRGTAQASIGSAPAAARRPRIVSPVAGTRLCARPGHPGRPPAHPHRHDRRGLGRAAPARQPGSRPRRRHATGAAGAGPAPSRARRQWRPRPRPQPVHGALSGLTRAASVRQERRVDLNLDTMMRFAERLADAARAETLPRWRTGCAAADKNEGGAWDPVTEADREAERAMRRLIEAEFPDHGIQGEEFRGSAGGGPLVLEPRPGRRHPLLRLRPAELDDAHRLARGREARCSASSTRRRLDERYAGASGGEAHATSGCTSLAEARLSTTDPYLFSGAEREAWNRGPAARAAPPATASTPMAMPASPRARSTSSSRPA